MAHRKKPISNKLFFSLFQSPKATYIGICLMVAFVARVWTIIPNFSPLLAIALFLSSHISKSRAFIVFVSFLLVTDGFLGGINHYPILGDWSFFTYSGFLGMILLNSNYLATLKIERIATSLMVSNLGFWMWTNLGTWMLSGMYLHTWPGLAECFILALPFLGYSLIGSMLWGMLIFGAWFIIDRKEQQFMAQIENP